MRRAIYLIALILLSGPRALNGQATSISAPAKNYLLSISQRWGNRSPLGDLIKDRRGADDIEIRLWGGYGLAGTSGTVLRRRSGRWSAFDADVRQCNMRVKDDERITERRWAELEAKARKRCPETEDGSYVSVEWVVLGSVAIPGDPDSLYQRLVDARLLELPSELHPGWIMLDGFTYVLEVRTGDSYRASVAPQSESSHDPNDESIRTIATLLSRLRAPR